VEIEIWFRAQGETTMHVIPALVLSTTLLFNPVLDPPPPLQSVDGPAHRFGLEVQNIRENHRHWKRPQVVRSLLDVRPSRTDFTEKQLERIEKGQWSNINRELVDLLCAAFRCTEGELNALLSEGYPFSAIPARGEADAADRFWMRAHGRVAIDPGARAIVEAGVAPQVVDEITPLQTLSVLSRIEGEFAADWPEIHASSAGNSISGFFLSHRKGKRWSRAKVVRDLATLALQRYPSLYDRISADWLIGIEEKGRTPSYDEILMLCELYNCSQEERYEVLQMGGPEALVNRDGTIDLVGAYWRQLQSLVAKYPDIKARIANEMNQQASESLDDTKMLYILEIVLQSLKEKVAAGKPLGSLTTPETFPAPAELEKPDAAPVEPPVAAVAIDEAAWKRLEEEFARMEAEAKRIEEEFARMEAEEKRMEEKHAAMMAEVQRSIDEAQTLQSAQVESTTLRALSEVGTLGAPNNSRGLGLPSVRDGYWSGSFAYPMPLFRLITLPWGGRMLPLLP
jgi:hypothetical protein